MAMSKPNVRWTHPVHARGIRSPRFDLRGGKLLSNSSIHKYAALGYYGAAAQTAAREADKAKTKKKRAVVRKPTGLSLALNALKGI